MSGRRKQNPGLSNEEWERRFQKFVDPDYYTRPVEQEPRSLMGSSLGWTLDLANHVEREGARDQDGNPVKNQARVDAALRRWQRHRQERFAR